MLLFVNASFALTAENTVLNYREMKNCCDIHLVRINSVIADPCCTVGPYVLFLLPVLPWKPGNGLGSRMWDIYVHKMKGFHMPWRACAYRKKRMVELPQPRITHSSSSSSSVTATQGIIRRSFSKDGQVSSKHRRACRVGRPERSLLPVFVSGYLVIVTAYSSCSTCACNTNVMFMLVHAFCMV